MPSGVDPVSYSWAEYNCVMGAGYIPDPPLSDENVALMYEAEMAAYRCVKARGLDVDELPSPRTYAEQVKTHLPGRWSPFAHVDSWTSQGAAALTACDPEKLQSRPFTR